MKDLNAALAESQAALEQLMAAAERCGPRWSAPRAEGKWSPSQICEHVARALEESGKDMRGEPSAFPSLPGFVRPLVRGLFFNRVLKKNAFINGKTNKAMNPAAGPETAAQGRARLQQAHDAFAQACRGCGERFNHGIFGDIATADYARFQALHTLHHTKQIPSAWPAAVYRAVAIGIH
ncbi:MAG TPA: DUF1569 domain-containing protein [Vicinamibacterales bacterium]|nr:DUF1569 domain-containing protein [Vicinamibacterales bacterium]